jgi:hypothetical protein
VIISIWYFWHFIVTPPLWFRKPSAGFAAVIADLNAGANGPVAEATKPIFKVLVSAKAFLGEAHAKRNEASTNAVTQTTDTHLFLLISSSLSA